MNYMKFSKLIDEETKCELLSAKSIDEFLNIESDIKAPKREPFEKARSIKLLQICSIYALNLRFSIKCVMKGLMVGRIE